MRKLPNAHSSRRATPLKDSDYDHEITLVDHVAEAAPPQPLSPDPHQQEHTTTPTAATTTTGTSLADHSALEQSWTVDTADTAQTQAQTHSLSEHTTAVSNTSDAERQAGPSARRKKSSASVETVSTRRDASSASSASTSKSKKSKKSGKCPKRSSLRSPKSRSKTDIPKVEVQEPTPLNKPSGPTHRHSRGRPHPETAIDVLYENQRGALLCGIKIFSPKALGQLDPPAWTNVAHKPSPTDIHTAQVPDPSWQWAWPEWHVNRDEGMDQEGWEYSFMFARAFSWHPPRWYNSFVRRRAWTRMRASAPAGGDTGAADPHMLGSEYFTVRPFSMDTTRTGGSGANNTKTRSSSRHSAARASASFSSSAAGRGSADGKIPPVVEDVDTLMAVLHLSRIDREKIEAVDNFLAHGGEELVHLQHRMHDVMAVFVFQASRRALLSRLHEALAETRAELGRTDTGSLQRRADYLAAAVRHADEECQKLEYWSDIRKVVMAGESETAVDACGGWGGEGWRGVDNSGPGVPCVPPSGAGGGDGGQRHEG